MALIYSLSEFILELWVFSDYFGNCIYFFDYFYYFPIDIPDPSYNYLFIDVGLDRTELSGVHVCMNDIFGVMCF